MSNEPKNHHPYTPPHKHLGKCLKTMRQKFQESLGETSGAVEIEVEQLDRFERGAELPSEDVLMLLISHFGLQDNEAVELWELAGYDSEIDFETDRGHYHDHKDDNRYGNQAHANDSHNRHNSQATPIMLLAFDNRILYSNEIDIADDDSGMVLNFMQNIPNGQSGGKADANTPHFPVSRIGMSHKQAEKLIHDLQQALLRKKYISGPKQLPPPKQ